MRRALLSPSNRWAFLPGHTSHSSASLPRLGCVLHMPTFRSHSGHSAATSPCSCASVIHSRHGTLLPFSRLAGPSSLVHRLVHFSSKPTDSSETTSSSIPTPSSRTQPRASPSSLISKLLTALEAEQSTNATTSAAIAPAAEGWSSSGTGAASSFFETFFSVPPPSSASPATASQSADASKAFSDISSRPAVRQSLSAAAEPSPPPEAEQARIVTNPPTTSSQSRNSNRVPLGSTRLSHPTLESATAHSDIEVKDVTRQHALPVQPDQEHDATLGEFRVESLAAAAFSQQGFDSAERYFEAFGTQAADVLRKQGTLLRMYSHRLHRHVSHDLDAAELLKHPDLTNLFILTTDERYQLTPKEKSLPRRGERILDLIVSDYLFNKYPAMSNEALSENKESYLNHEYLSMCVSSMALNDFLCHEVEKIPDQVFTVPQKERWFRYERDRILSALFSGTVAHIYDQLGYAIARKFALQHLRVRQQKPLYIRYADTYPEKHLVKFFQRLEFDQGWKQQSHPSRIALLKQTAHQCTAGLYVPDQTGDAHVQFHTSTASTSKAAKLKLMEEVLNKVYNTPNADECIPNFFLDNRNRPSPLELSF